MKHTELITMEAPELLSQPQERRKLQAAAKLLRDGGLVAIPTETVYGLAADALNPAAVAGIFRAKGRPQDNPLIVHISSLAMLPKLIRGELPAGAAQLAQRYWPGPLTMIFPKSSLVPDVTSGGLDTVAVRFPSHPVAQELIRLAGVPLAAPSANLSGKPSPTTAVHCIQDLMGRVDAIVDGGPCGVGVESTVISFAEEVPLLLRPGAVTLEQLREVLPQVQVHDAVYHQLSGEEKAASPGMKYKHYAPAADLILVDAPRDAFVQYVNSHADPGVYAMCFEEDIPCLRVPYLSYGPSGEPAVQAELLFEVLRQLDECGAVRVYAHCPSKDGVGLAVYNRIVRSAGYQIITLETGKEY